MHNFRYFKDFSSFCFHNKYVNIVIQVDLNQNELNVVWIENFIIGADEKLHFFYGKKFVK